MSAYIAQNIEHMLILLSDDDNTSSGLAVEY